MKKSIILQLIIILFISYSSYAQVKLISAGRIEINSAYDSMANKEMNGVMDSYRNRLEKEVSRTIGNCSEDMLSHKPESLLSNFLSDQLLAKANELAGDSVDFSVMNMGGIRASLNKGPVRISDVYRIMPFDNKLVILRLKGTDARSVFERIAEVGGEGVSNVRLEIAAKKVASIEIGGKPLEDNKFYNVATMDYLAEGNSGMKAFLNAISRDDTGMLVRDVFISRIEKITSEGKSIESNLDGRIKVK